MPLKLSQARLARIAEYEAILRALQAKPPLRYDRIAKAIGCGLDKVRTIARNNGFIGQGRR